MFQGVLLGVFGLRSLIPGPSYPEQGFFFEGGGGYTADGQNPALP